jgi:hypothetical protein
VGRRSNADDAADEAVEEGERCEDHRRVDAAVGEESGEAEVLPEYEAAAGAEGPAEGLAEAALDAPLSGGMTGR